MVNIVYSTERGPEKSLDKSKFKLRWHRASDLRAFNNTENVWANSCHGFPQQFNRKGTISGEKDFTFYLKLMQTRTGWLSINNNHGHHF